MYVALGCPACEAIADELSQTGLRQRIEVVDARLADTPSQPHSMIDDEDHFVGHRAMAGHLEELAELVRDWTRFQSDICYFEECSESESPG